MAHIDPARSFRASPHLAGGANEAGLIEAIAGWCDCLQGRLPLLAALKNLADGLDARAVVLSRHSREPGGPVRAVAFNQPAFARAGHEASRSYAHCVLGRYVDRPRPASVWLASLTEGHEDPTLEVWQARARVAETVVIALALEEKWADYIEFHLATPPSLGAQAVLNSLADTLSRTWMRRSPGLFSDAILAGQSPARKLREPILSTGNPARLSRAEFRVCVLLSRGLNTASVCGELSISPSTLKAHLRSVFAKTATSSMAELLYLLLAPWDAGADLAVAARRA